MARALFNGQVIAESDTFEEVEGNLYFPKDSLNEEYFKPSNKTTTCGWKGTANYFDVVVGSEKNPDAAWYYAEPKARAQHIANHVAFWRGVIVER